MTETDDQSLQALAALADHEDVGLFVFSNRVLTYGSRGLRIALGHAPDTPLVGRSVGQLLPAPNLKGEDPEGRLLDAADSRGLIHQTLAVVDNLGATRHLEIHGTVHGVAGEEVVVGIVVNRTAEENLEEQLRHAQKMEAIGQLTAGVAHDFGNLLASIDANAQLLLRDRDLEAAGTAWK